MEGTPLSTISNTIIGIKDMEIEATRRALTDMKDVSDRAIKLAETAKPKVGGWELYGVLGLAVFVAGLVVGGL